MRTRIGATTAIVAGLLLGAGHAAHAAAPLVRVQELAMPASVRGRFDHLTVDSQSHRLFATAESAHAVLVYDLRTGRLVHTIGGIAIPHAVLYRPRLDRLYITDGGAGELRIYDGTTYRLLTSVTLKVDTDSIAYDASTHDLYVVNGGGDAHESSSLISVIDTTAGRKVADIRVEGRTLEAMALARGGAAMYVNNAADNQVDVIDRRTRKVTAVWPVTSCTHNVAMALDGPSHRLFVACRSGAMAVLDTRTGHELQTLPIGKGVDDLIFDPASRRLYATCGAGGGVIDVYREDTPDRYTRLGDVASGPGGKNEALVPALKRLYVTIPPRGTAPGAIDVYRVQ
ncbi:MAG TPA: YncE family protein [Vicinamibacterales bacterium]|nr:YncE family protein [Vicinamibacterales bacterium]